MLLAALWALPIMGTGPTALAAQSPESPLLKGGQIRLEMLPEVRLWSERYGGTQSPFDQTEPLAADFFRSSVDTTFLPALQSVQDDLRALLADSGLVADLGATRARFQANRTEIPLGLGIGIFDWLTVGVKVPFVRRRVEVDLALDPTTATLGRSPGLNDAAVQTYLAELSAVIDHVTALVDQRCTTLGSSDPVCVRGQNALGEANLLSSNLGDAYLGLFFPLGGSAAAGALTSRAASIQALLLQEGDPTFIEQTWVTPLPFANSGLSEDDLQTLMTAGAYGVSADPISSQRSLWELGDVEFSAALRLFEHVPARDPATRVDTAGAPTSGGGLGVLLGVGATYRLGTGTPDLARNFVDLGSGDGQDDIELQVFGRLDLGGRIRTRFEARYGMPQEGQVTRRIGAPDQPIRPISTERVVTWQPGTYLDAMIAPEIRVAPEFSLGVRYRYTHKGADTYRLPGGEDPSLPPVELLQEETELTVQHLGIGATLWPSPRSAARDQWPLAVSAEYQRPLGGKGGAVPKDSRFSVSARLFVQLW